MRVSHSGSGPLPYVSIVVTGRNDGYGGDFVTRFLATLQFNHRELAMRAIPHEFLLVEWAPVPGAPLLADLVESRCPPSVVAGLRAVIVDPAYHEAMTLNPRLVYHEFLAKNVGVRRARGEYVLTTNCDVILGRHVLQRLERRDLEPAVVYRASRWDLRATLNVERLDWACLEDTANLSRPPKRLRPPYFRGSAGDFIALDRATFHGLGGFNEVYRGARFGVDANFLIHALSSGVAIVDIGGPVYHIDHEGSYQTVRAQYAGRESDAHYGDERWPYNDVVYRNRPTWGLSGAPERAAGSRHTYLDFSWDAVPPLVDLAGVVLPAERGSAGGDPARRRG
ncbi:MAG: hypothetical protein HYY76_12035 [Acidobacteria bacterium]|nr:hypothetical protein [Acidobacteriota bacterium]